MNAEALLRQSNAEYRRLLALVAPLADEVSCLGPEEIAARAGDLETILGEIQGTDGALAHLMKDATAGHFEPLWRERNELLRQLIDLYQHLAPVLDAMLAVVNAEMAGLTQGKRALAGYRSNSDVRGGLVDMY